jgi:hypothetical protein
VAPPRRPRKGQLGKGQALIESLLRGLPASVRDEARRFRALKAWHDAAGPRIRARVRGERVQGTTLVLRVSSAAWANELGMMRAELLKKLQETPGGEWLEDLRFTVGPLDGAPSWEEPDEPAPAPTARAHRPAIDDGQVAAALAEVSDPELRRALAELFARARRS